MPNVLAPGESVLLELRGTSAGKPQRFAGRVTAVDAALVSLDVVEYAGERLAGDECEWCRSEQQYTHCACAYESYWLDPVRYVFPWVSVMSLRMVIDTREAAIEASGRTR